MVDQAATKEEASDGGHGESSKLEECLTRKQDFKKKGSRSSNINERLEGISKLLKGLWFSIMRDGPDLYLKAVKRLELYVCVHTRMDLSCKCI